ncbi:MAG: DNA-binding protein [Bacteroidetes bacterium]|nr:DNA-binding protein [Bacteroidota bacterium]
MAPKDDVICIKTSAFYALIDEVVAHIDAKHGLPKVNKWIDIEEAMAMLKITSRTTLQEYRDAGDIGFSRLSHKVILYDRDSILDFLERNAQKTF